ncbi:MAG: alpha-ketoglutarate-dependent dioxygenase AlkB, partial [Hyphomonadaceae bacterium]
MAQTMEQAGFRLWPGKLSRAAQEALRDAIFARLRQGPFYVPRMPKSGAPMSVRMTNFGPLGWVTDKERGYRYQATHPETDRPWPDIPPIVLDLWSELAGYHAPPEACLVNLYESEAKM